MNKRSIGYGVCLLLTLVGWLSVTLLSDHRVSHSAIAPVFAAQAPAPDSSLNVPTSTAQSAIPLLANGKIAFTSTRDGNREIYVMNADGTNQIRLTSNIELDDHPTWSPDGTKIAFLCQRPTGSYAICLMNADGTNRVEITPVNYDDHSNFTFDYWSMSWSPDGQRIAFQDNGDIFVINADGSNRQRLINDPADDIQPSWSPDGAKILFARSRDNSRFEVYYHLYSINHDGTDLRPLASQIGFSDTASTWSPTGHMIAFTVVDYANFENILIANADGTNRQIFDNGGLGENFGVRNYPEWSPDGSKIIFQIGLGAETEIYVKNVDGYGFARLTNTPGQNFKPSWQPLPIRVIPRRPSLPHEPIIRRGGI